MKSVKYIIKDPASNKLMMQDCKGYVPENVVAIAPDSAVMISDLDIDEVAGVAVLNQQKVDARTVAEEALKQASIDHAAQEALKIAKLKNDLKNAATIDDLKSILTRMAKYIKSLRD